MIQHLSLFWSLCLLRAGPERVPYGPALAGQVAGAWLLSALPLVLGSPHVTTGRGLALILGNLVVEVAVVALLLAARGHAARLLQTVTALLGADLLLNLLALPVVLPWAGSGPGAPGYAVAAVLQLLIFGWGIAVKGHILRAALEVSRVAGNLLAVALAFGLLLLTGLLFPELAAPPAGDH